jgi:hypothetical protein
MSDPPVSAYLPAFESSSGVYEIPANWRSFDPEYVVDTGTYSWPDYILDTPGTGSFTADFLATGPVTSNILNEISCYCAWVTWLVSYIATSNSWTVIGSVNNPVEDYQGPAYTYTPAAGYKTNGMPVNNLLQSIAITPKNPNVQVGETLQFTATGTFSDGTVIDVTDTAGWYSSNTVVATILLAGGLATGTTIGTSTITAMMSGITQTVTLSVVAAGPTLSYITVTPAVPNSLTVGGTQQFMATGTYSDGSTQNLTSQVTWESANPTVASINSAGLANAVAAGTTIITAELYPVSSTPVTLSVASPTLISIVVSPATPPSLTVGSTQQFTATGNYSDGSTKNITNQVTWESTSPGIATITSGGLVNGIAAGSTTIIAALYLVSSTPVNLTVGSGSMVMLTSIAVTPGNPYNLSVGSTQQFTATGTYSDGSTEDITSAVTWNSSDTGVAIISPNGLATGVADGSTDITASLSAYTSDIISLTVISSATTLSAIAISPSAPAALNAGDTLQFSATGTYSDGSITDITSQVTWASSNTAVVVISTNGLATAVSAGTTAITAAISPITSTPVTLTVTGTPGPGPAASGSYWESLLPMPPQDGPPLPAFLSFKWPWLKTPTTPGNLQITVYDASTQQLLKGAAVTVIKGTTFLDEVFQRSVAPTNASGFCSFTFPPGTYSVECAKIGYITQGVDVTVTASGGSATVNLVPSS